MSGNPLSSVPSEITKLSLLKSFYGQRTIMKTIICFFKTFGLTDLEEFPTIITSLTGLTHLGVNPNGLTAVPSELTYLSSLVSIEFQNGMIASIPSEITNLVNLTGI